VAGFELPMTFGRGVIRRMRRFDERRMAAHGKLITYLNVKLFVRLIRPTALLEM